MFAAFFVCVGEPKRFAVFCSEFKNIPSLNGFFFLHRFFAFGAFERDGRKMSKSFYYEVAAEIRIEVIMFMFIGTRAKVLYLFY